MPLGPDSSSREASGAPSRQQITRATQASRRRRVFAFLAATSVCFAAAAPIRPAPQPQGGERPFSANTVLELARKMSTEAYVQRKLPSGSPLPQLTYGQYRDIRFNSQAGVWRNDEVPFRLEPLPAGFLFQTPVSISVIEDRLARELVSAPTMFQLGPLAAQTGREPGPALLRLSSAHSPQFALCLG